jgi:FkbM family methyltransferase
MKNKIKIIITNISSALINFLGKIKFIELLYEQVLNFSLNRTTKIEHNKATFTFAIPNALCRWRVKSFSTKEPETLEWIDSIPAGATLWDIGANIGLYSVYAAKKNQISVIAFEPSVFNLELLARNIFLNNLTNKVCIVPLPLSNQISTSELKMTSTEWGGALSTFGENFGWDGKIIKELFSYQLIGLDMDSAINKLGISKPDYIKMDVDGLEHFILMGGKNVLCSINSILIEVNDDFEEQAIKCKELLTNAGMILKEKRHSDEIDDSNSGFQNTYNQIWVRA